MSYRSMVAASRPRFPRGVRSRRRYAPPRAM